MEEFKVPAATLEPFARCDACIQFAVHTVGAGIGAFYLYLCNHHYVKHEPALVESGWVKIVEEKLNDDLDATPAKV